MATWIGFTGALAALTLIARARRRRRRRSIAALLTGRTPCAVRVR